MVKNRFNTISKKKRDEIKTMNKFKKPLDEVIEEIKAEENYNNENDEVWIDDMINQLSNQISNLDISSNDGRYEMNMQCLNSPPTIINDNILCDDNILENPFIKEQEEASRFKSEKHVTSIKDTNFGKKPSLQINQEVNLANKRKQGIQSRYLTNKLATQQNFCTDTWGYDGKINNISQENAQEEVSEPASLGNESLKTNTCAGVLNYVENVQNNFHFITSPANNIGCKEPASNGAIYSKINFFDSAKSTQFKAPMAKISDCPGFIDSSRNNVLSKTKMNSNDCYTSYNNIYNNSSTKNANSFKQAKAFLANLNDRTSKNSVSKEIKEKNSVNNIKKSLFDLHRDESKKLEKSLEKSKTVCSAYHNSSFQKSPGFNNEFCNDNLTTNKIESSIIPKELPQNTKKFIEVKSEEVIYLTPEGRIYTEDKNGKLIELDNLSSLKPKNETITNVTKIIHSKNKSSLSESLSAPTLNANERGLSKPEQMSTSELFMNPFTNPAISQMPFGMISPSMHPSNYINYEMFTNNCSQNNPIHSLAGTPSYMNQIRRIDHNSYNQ